MNSAFSDRFFKLPQGYSEGHYNGLRYGVTASSSRDGKRHNLYAEDLGGNDHVSLNLYLLKTGEPVLKPCEMPEEKVIDFVLNFQLADAD